MHKYTVFMQFLQGYTENTEFLLGITISPLIKKIIKRLRYLCPTIYVIILKILRRQFLEKGLTFNGSRK